jgi:hypothetical protein
MLILTFIYGGAFVFCLYLAAKFIWGLFQEEQPNPFLGPKDIKIFVIILVIFVILLNLWAK